MPEIKKEKTEFGTRLTLFPFATGKFSLMEITTDVTMPKTGGRCEIATRFAGTPGFHMMRPAEVVVFVEGLRAIGKEARELADKRQGKKAAKKSAAKPKKPAKKQG